MGLTRVAPDGFEAFAHAIGDLRARRLRGVVTGGGTLAGVAEATDDADVELSSDALIAPPVHEPADLIVTCRAGVTLAALEEVLRANGQTLPVWHPDPGRATVGGLVAFGWQSPGARLFGRLRDRVLEVRVATGEGKLVRGGAKVVKNVTGFDLPRLFFGSLGTLGAILEVSFKVHPAPDELFGARIDGNDPSAMARLLLSALRTGGQPMEALLVLEEGESRGFLFAPGPESDARLLMSGLSDAEGVVRASDGFAALASDGIQTPSDDGALVVRISVLPSELPSLLSEESALRALVDVASGTAWLKLARPEGIGELRRRAESTGGSLVLIDAASTVRRTCGTFWSPGSPPPGAELMSRLKRQFDPDGVLGAGRLAL